MNLLIWHFRFCSTHESLESLTPPLRRRRTRRMACDNDEKAQRAEIAAQAQRGRVRGAGRTPVVAEPVVDDTEAAPAAPSAAITPPTPDETTAMVAAAVAKAVTARRRGAGALRRAEKKA